MFFWWCVWGGNENFHEYRSFFMTSREISFLFIMTHKVHLKKIGPFSWRTSNSCILCRYQKWLMKIYALLWHSKCSFIKMLCPISDFFFLYQNGKCCFLYCFLRRLKSYPYSWQRTNCILYHLLKPEKSVIFYLDMQNIVSSIVSKKGLGKSVIFKHNILSCIITQKCFRKSFHFLWWQTKSDSI